ncbi:MAG: alpha/beta hydrolase [Acetobacteraceae bacterium]
MTLLLHVISPTGPLNALAPTDGITLTSGAPYATGDGNTLDVYAPRPGAAPAPVVVFFYGGAWASGSKEIYRYVGAALAARGVMAVIPDYRVYPYVRFPTFMYDAAEAVAWTRANASRLGGDPRRLFLMGHSAGAQIAALLAMDKRYLRSVDLSPQDVCGMIGLAGPYDFTQLRGVMVKEIFGPQIELDRAMPINFASSDNPPLLLLAGWSDFTVEPGNTQRLADRVRAAGGSVRAEFYSGIGHTTLLAALSGSLAFLAPVREETMRFIDARGACSQAPRAVVGKGAHSG